MNNKTELQSKIALGLKKYRVLKGYTQSDLAEKSAVSISTIRRIEQRGMPPKISTLVRLAKHLNCSPEEIINFDDETNFVSGKKNKPHVKKIDIH